MAIKTRYQVFLWLLLTLVGAGYYVQSLVLDDSHPDFLPGQTSHGHYQIELACESCHTEPFGSEKIIQNACLDCHKEELNQANDSHPVKKFTDPRNADRLAILDARYCVSCHKEHVPQHTRTMGVTLPDDFCEACHKDIAKERPSHEGMGFDTCASAGCHNYHDNKALYESFLLKHSAADDTKPLASIVAMIESATSDTKAQQEKKLTLADARYPTSLAMSGDELVEWEHSEHANAGVNCVDCHTNDSQKVQAESSNNKLAQLWLAKTWIEKPSLEQCVDCHKDQVKGFTAGKHGMRLAATANGSPLPAMTVGESRLAQADKMHANAFNSELSCNSCHSAHSFDRKEAAVESCLGCHNDEHSQQFKQSKHFTLKSDALIANGHLNKETASDPIVTCASCHLPETEIEHFGQKKTIVQHNQNHNLRPNEKMIRSVCLDCHSLRFSIDALADDTLIKNNFNDQPATHIQSIDMALEREKK